ncbi:MAG: hypothetical protein PW843_23855 [Azospirillaceae bacterium]|nr:hypothetical protein [Azospirillaceae bacterium]
MIKKLMLVFGLVVLPSLAGAVDMTPEQIRATLNANGMPKMVALYDKGLLVLDTKNTTVNIMRLTSTRGIYKDAEAENAMYWYRGMSSAEANTFVAGGSNSVAWQQNSYVGIAPQYSYVQKYLTSADPGAIIEFGTDNAGWLYTQWSKDHPCKVKAEGGGTYGLGYTGSTASCNQGTTAYKPPIQGLGQIFNPWLEKSTVRSQVVYVLADRNK